MDIGNSSPFYRTFSPIRTAAQKRGKERRKLGKFLENKENKDKPDFAFIEFVFILINYLGDTLTRPRAP